MSGQLLATLLLAVFVLGFNVGMFVASLLADSAKREIAARLAVLDARIRAALDDDAA